MSKKQYFSIYISLQHGILLQQIWSRHQIRSTVKYKIASCGIFYRFSSLQSCYWLNTGCQNNLVIVFSFVMGEQIKIYINKQNHEWISNMSWLYSNIIMKICAGSQETNNRIWLLKFSQRIQLHWVLNAMPWSAHLGKQGDNERNLRTQ